MRGKVPHGLTKVYNISILLYQTPTTTLRKISLENSSQLLMSFKDWVFESKEERLTSLDITFFDITLDSRKRI